MSGGGRLFRGQHGWNFAALVLSAAAASVAPLQVFIFVYAFVGPLHYLTEMAWLRKKEFYFREGIVSPRSYLAIAALLCVAGSVDFYLHRGVTGYAVGILVVLSLSPLVKNPYVLLASLVAGYCAKFFVHGLVLFIGTILPTIVHVYLFTGLFMISGLVREKRPGVLACLNPLLLALLPLGLLMATWHYRAPGAYWVKAETGFSALHVYLAGLLGRNLHPDASILSDPAAAGVLRFLAFIYLYHYLNWFAKTELLQWHKVSGKTWGLIGVLYCFSIGCYLWNFVVGFYIVNFLSLLHIFLEFPLNWHTSHFLLSSVARLWNKHEGESVAA